MKITQILAILLALTGLYCMVSADALKQFLLGLLMFGYSGIRLSRRYFWAKRAAQKAFAGRPERGDITIETSAKGVRIQDADTDSTTKWKAFDKLILTKDGLLLYPESGVFFWIPATADFALSKEEGTNDDWESFSSLLREKIPH